MQFTHNVKDANWLIDKACLAPHIHGFNPNPPCICEFIVATKEIIDFKLVKKLGKECIEELANKIIKVGKETEKEGFVEYPYYDFGTLTTEEMTDDLRKLMWAKLEKLKLHPLRIQVWLDETKKYSIWDDGVPSKQQLNP